MYRRIKADSGSHIPQVALLGSVNIPNLEIDLAPSRVLFASSLVHCTG
jgi:hypothetical protein